MHCFQFVADLPVSFCLILLQHKQICKFFSVLTVLFFLCALTASPEDESSGLYGSLNVIVHSASGLKQSLSESLNILS